VRQSQALGARAPLAFQAQIVMATNLFLFEITSNHLLPNLIGLQGPSDSWWRAGHCFPGAAW
jgi:hypothetical protein